MPANPPHSFGYASGLPPQSDRKIYANLRVYFISDSYIFRFCDAMKHITFVYVIVTFCNFV